MHAGICRCASSNMIDSGESQREILIVEDDDFTMYMPRGSSSAALARTPDFSSTPSTEYMSTGSVSAITSPIPDVPRTMQYAFIMKSDSELASMRVSPSELMVTTPVPLTVAISSSSELQLMRLSSASAGKTVAVSWNVLPMPPSIRYLFSSMSVTSTSGSTVSSKSLSISDPSTL